MSEPGEDRRSLLALCALEGVNWHVIAREAQRHGDVSRLRRGDLAERSRDAQRTAELLAEADESDGSGQERADQEIERAHETGARLITVLDDDYPANLRVIYNLPPFLFVRGALNRSDTRSVAVVGTRAPSETGLDSARRIARRLVAERVTVLSGLAKGIDAAAHEETLDRGGRTVAVLGTGILRCYPKEHADLAERIAETGALVSQFWPSQPPAAYTFPRRNVVTSGLGQGTVVIEASRTSGAKMQARLALDHGKRVFLVSRLVTEQPWARKYLERGAVEVRTVEDVVSRLRSPEEIEELSAGRRRLAGQLALELA